MGDNIPRGSTDQRQSGSGNWRDHPYCEKCKRRHLGECKPRACYNCNSCEHLKRNCPQSIKGDRKTDDTLTPARVFSLTEPAVAESKTVVAGQLSSAGTSLTILFDSGATHSFISTRLVDQLCRPGSMLDRPMHIILPGGERVVSRRGI